MCDICRATIFDGLTRHEVTDRRFLLFHFFVFCQWTARGSMQIQALFVPFSHMSETRHLFAKQSDRMMLNSKFLVSNGPRRSHFNTQQPTQSKVVHVNCIYQHNTYHTSVERTKKTLTWTSLHTLNFMELNVEMTKHQLQLNSSFFCFSLFIAMH